MQRQALFSAIDRLNLTDSDRGSTYVANGDGITTVIENDLRADLGGFLQTSKESYSGRRTAPISATPAVAINESETGRDLLVRLKMNQDKESTRDQALATREYSQHDAMLMNFFIDAGTVGIRKKYTYENELHLATQYVKHISPEERLRRVKMALEATGCLTDYAQQARNATSGEPQKVLIVFDTRLSRKAARYFKDATSDAERANILKELDARGAQYFLGDDTSEDGDSVFEAYQKAQEFLGAGENTLYDPDPDNDTLVSTAEFEKGA
jgi:CRISPR-associated protein Cst2